LETDITSREAIDIPDDLLVLDEDQITIEPGEQHELDVLLNPEKGNAGLYSGYISARTEDDEAVVNVPVGFYMEPKKHTLTVKVEERSGQPALYPSRLDVMNADDTKMFFESNQTFRD